VRPLFSDHGPSGTIVVIVPIVIAGGAVTVIVASLN
jgi:hypothetical protein